VFDEKFAKAHQSAFTRFFAMTNKAKELIATSDEAWRIVAARIGVTDKAALDLYRRRYIAGLPRRPIAEEEADAARLYAVLAKIGGEKLVGPNATLDPGTFYKAPEGAAH